MIRQLLADEQQEQSDLLYGGRRCGKTRLLERLVFYDQDLGHDFWGADLSRYLPHVYDREAELRVLLVSEDHVKRFWPRLEARAALAKAAREGWDVVIVASIDGAILPDYPEDVRRGLGGSYTLSASIT